MPLALQYILIRKVILNKQDQNAKQNHIYVYRLMTLVYSSLPPGFIYIISRLRCFRFRCLLKRKEEVKYQKKKPASVSKCVS